jgi:hypothetical protein
VRPSDIQLLSTQREGAEGSEAEREAEFDVFRVVDTRRNARDGQRRTYCLVKGTCKGYGQEEARQRRAAAPGDPRDRGSLVGETVETKWPIPRQEVLPR